MPVDAGDEVSGRRPGGGHREHEDGDGGAGAVHRAVSDACSPARTNRSTRAPPWCSSTRPDRIPTPGTRQPAWRCRRPTAADNPDPRRVASATSRSCAASCSATTSTWPTPAPRPPTWRRRGAPSAPTPTSSPPSRTCSCAFADLRVLFRRRARRGRGRRAGARPAGAPPRLPPLARRRGRGAAGAVPGRLAASARPLRRGRPRADTSAGGGAVLDPPVTAARRRPDPGRRRHPRALARARARRATRSTTLGAARSTAWSRPLSAATRSSPTWPVRSASASSTNLGCAPPATPSTTEMDEHLAALVADPGGAEARRPHGRARRVPATARAAAAAPPGGRPAGHPSDRAGDDDPPVLPPPRSPGRAPAHRRRARRGGRGDEPVPTAVAMHVLTTAAPPSELAAAASSLATAGDGAPGR